MTLVKKATRLEQQLCGVGKSTKKEISFSEVKDKEPAMLIFDLISLPYLRLPRSLERLLHQNIFMVNKKIVNIQRALQFSVEFYYKQFGETK